MRLTSLSMCVAIISIGLQAQTTPAAGTDPQQPAAPAAPTIGATAQPSPWTKGGTDFSFWFDGYADANFNHPDTGFNDLRNFDYRADTAHVNLAKISIDHAPAPFGFHADIGFGEALYGMHALDPSGSPDAMKYIEQAY